jgi:hypothetical protein
MDFLPPVVVDAKPPDFRRIDDAIVMINCKLEANAATQHLLQQER